MCEGGGVGWDARGSMALGFLWFRGWDHTYFSTFGCTDTVQKAVGYDEAGCDS